MRKQLSFILLASFSFFLFSSKAYAVQNVGIYSDLTIAESGLFRDNRGVSSSNSIGYQFYSTFYNDKEYFISYPSSGTSYNYNSWGGSIIQCGMSFAKDNYYSVSYYFKTQTSSTLHPYYTTLSNKLAIASSVSDLSMPNFNYTDVSHSVEKVSSEYGGYDFVYTVVFKAPTYGTCLLSAFSGNPSLNSQNVGFLGYKYESLGSDNLSAADISNALSNKFSDIQNNIDNSTNTIVGNQEQNKQEIIDNANQNHEKAEETRKGIWASLTDGIANIGKWFTDLASSIGDFFKELGESIANGFTSLFDSIKSLFVGEEVCDVIEQNYFKGYDIDGIYPDSEGWITLEYTSNSNGKLYSSSSIKDLEMSKSLNVFLEVKEASSSSLGRFFPINGVNSQVIGDNSSAVFLKDLSINNSDWKRKDNIFNFKLSLHENDTYFLRSSLLNWNNGTSKIIFRMLITDDMTMTLENYEYYNSKEECTSKGGLFGILGDFFKSVGEFFSNLFSFLGDDSGPDMSGLENTAGWLPAGPVDSLVNLPLSLFSNLSSSLGAACSPVSLSLPFVHKNIELPCLNQWFSNIKGLSSWITSIGFIAAAFMLYTYLLNLYKWVDDTLTMRENNWNDMNQWGGI